MRTVGPIRIKGAVEGDISVPLATLETPLWFSVGRGAIVSLKSGGITTTILDSRMTFVYVSRSCAVGTSTPDIDISAPVLPFQPIAPPAFFVPKAMRCP